MKKNNNKKANIIIPDLRQMNKQGGSCYAGTLQITDG